MRQTNPVALDVEIEAAPEGAAGWVFAVISEGDHLATARPPMIKRVSARLR